MDLIHYLKAVSKMAWTKEKAREYSREYRQWCRDHNFCTCCYSEKAIPGKRYCYKCAEKARTRSQNRSPELREKMNEAARNRYQQAKEAGIQDIAVVDVSRENVQKKIDSSVTVEAYKDAGVNNREKNSSGRNNKKDKAAKDGSAPQQEQQKELKEKQKETQQVLAHPKEDLPEGADGSEGSPDAGSGLQ